MGLTSSVSITFAGKLQARRVLRPPLLPRVAFGKARLKFLVLIR
ncbi:hypothetical protein AB0A63_19720 [Lentzea sp. NPDC042327]